MTGDNKNGNEKTKLLPGGVYYVSTGSGVVHDETQHLPFSTRKLSQSAFEHGQNGNVPCQDGELLTQFFQVWWNGGIIYNETLPKCTTQIKQPSEIPLVLLEGGLAVRVLVGQLPLQQSTETATDNTETEGETKTKTKTKTEKATDTTTTENLQSPIDLMDMTPMLIMHCRIDPEGDTTIFLPPTMNGAAFVTGKGAQVVFDQIYCCQPDVSSQMALLPPGGKELRIRNPSKTMASEFMIFLGEPVRKPYCKYVGYGGKYLSEGAAREWSTVVDISIPPPFFRPVLLSLLRSPLSKTPKQVFFNPINIFDSFTHSITVL